MSASGFSVQVSSVWLGAWCCVGWAGLGWEGIWHGLRCVENIFVSKNADISYFFLQCLKGLLFSLTIIACT